MVNILDNGGLAEAYRAYTIFKKNNGEKANQRLPSLEVYNDDQLFFIGFATMWCETKRLGALASQLIEDVHSPSDVRIHATLSNNPDFQNAFQCKAGQSMVNPAPCKVW